VTAGKSIVTVRLVRVALTIGSPLARPRPAISTYRVMALALTTALAAGLLVGCGSISPPSSPTPTSHVVADHTTGESVTVPNVINRIGEGWPAHVEVLRMFGVGDKVVALAMFLDPSAPAQQWLFKIIPTLNKAQRTFSGAGFNSESLLQLKSDLLFLSNQSSSPALAAKTTELGIPTVELGFETYPELKQVVSTTADMLGPGAQAQAEACNAYLDATFARVTAVTSQIPVSQQPSVLHINSLNPLTVDGGPSMIDSWITAAGGRDVAQFPGAPGQGHGRQVTAEQIQAWNPDVIIVTAEATANAPAQQSLDSINANPALNTLAAVTNHRVYLNPTGAFDWDYYGIEEALQVQWAAKLLHPDEFADVNMVGVVKDFYSKFLHDELTDADAGRILADQPPT
jgi:iron complex transport system substrate-binding protein